MSATQKSEALCVLLIDDDPKRASELSAALDKSRYQVKHMIDADAAILKQVDALQPDVIIIDIESPSRDILESLHTLNSFNPKPIVMFSEPEDTNTINQSVHSGVSAYVARDVNASRVRAIMDAAVARFQQMQSLRNQLQDTQQELAARKTIEKAKALLMEKRQLTEKEAYQMIRKMAMDNGQRMEQVASNMIDFMTTLSP